MAAPQLFYQYPASLFTNTPNADGAGNWTDVTYSNINKLRGVIDDSTFIYFNPTAALPTFEADYGLTLPPAQVGINKITVYIRAWCRSHNNVAVDHTMYASLKPSGGDRADLGGQLGRRGQEAHREASSPLFFSPSLAQPPPTGPRALTHLPAPQDVVRAP